VAKNSKPKSIAELDKFLADGGFTRAKRPKGALERHRSQRDAELSPKRAKPTVKPKRQTNKLEILRADWNLPWLVHGFSTRTGGHSTAFGPDRKDLNLGISQHDSRDTVLKNRAAFFKSADADKLTLVSPKQIHSSIVHVLDSAKPPASTITADGLITNIPGLLLSIQTADCVPILLVDTKKKAIGAFHAGWRGAVARIVEKGVGMMRANYGSDPRNLRAAIGPCIAQCCYAVGEEVVDQFHSQFAYAGSLFKPYFEDDPIKRKYPLLFMTARAPGHSNLGPQIHLDLVEANRRQLLSAGLKPENIWSSDECTSCNTDRFFSYRKEAGFTGRMMAIIGISHSASTKNQR
jgi:YfiH family protein